MKAQTKKKLIQDINHVNNCLCQHQDQNQGVSLLLSIKRKIALASLKCLTFWISPSKKKKKKK